MVNIFNELPIPIYYFNFSLNITHDLHSYLDDNLEDENNIILTWELDTALTINANE
jgi:hypothetical protein